MEPRSLNLTRLGWSLALAVMFLAGVGLAAIHATDRSSPAGAPPLARLADAPWLDRAVDLVGETTLRQSAFLVVGAALLVGVIWVRYQRVGRAANAIYALAVTALALLVIDRYLFDLPFVPEVRRTHRWIDVGPVRIQPSEFMKLALVLVLARYLRYRTTYRKWWGLIPPFLLTLAPMLLILKQPDLGTLLMLPPVLFAMLFAAGARARHLLIVLGFCAASAPAFYLFGMHEYQRTRVEVLLRQGAADEKWHMNEGYQLRQSKVALGTGGLWGTGYREGVFVQYDGLLPEEHNDFIFAIVGNQWGFVGCCLVLLAYVAIVIVGLEVSTVTNDPFGRLLAVGVVVMIVFQAFLNICMTIGLAPITGMPLPFVSAGGSSLWTNLIGLGLLVSVAQRRPMLIANPPFEHAATE